MYNALSSARWLLVAAVALVVLGAVHVKSQAGAAARSTPTVVAVINVEKVFNNLKEFRDRNAELQARGRARQEELDKLKLDIQKLSKDAEVEERTSAKYRQMAAQAFELQQTLEARAKAFQQLINWEIGEIRSDTYRKILKGIETIAKRDGLDIVLFDDTGISPPEQALGDDVLAAIQSRRILFVSTQLDYSDQLITQMNNEYNAPAPRGR